MAKSLRSKRISELQARAKRSDILWMHRRNALHCLTGIQRLGEKTQLWCQRLIYALREQYTDMEIQKELDALQERLDHQKELLRRRLTRKQESEQDRAAQTHKPTPPEVIPGSDVW